MCVFSNVKVLKGNKGEVVFLLGAGAPHRLQVLKTGAALASRLPGEPFTSSENKVFKLLILPF